MLQFRARMRYGALSRSALELDRATPFRERRDMRLYGMRPAPGRMTGVTGVPTARPSHLNEKAAKISPPLRHYLPELRQPGFIGWDVRTSTSQTNFENVHYLWVIRWFGRKDRYRREISRIKHGHFAQVNADAAPVPGCQAQWTLPILTVV